jgi:DNA-binding transcriptional regulator YiaG
MPVSLEGTFRTQPMAKRKKGKRTRRSAEEKITELEKKIAELRALAKDRERYSPEAVKKDRARLELSAAAYAELVGVSMITIFSWESGRTTPRPEQLEKWLRVRALSRDEAWKAAGIEEVKEFSGKAVRAERDRLGLSASAYGELVGVSMLTIYNWEKGRSIPREKALDKWLAVKDIGRATALRRLGR